MSLYESWIPVNTGGNPNQPRPGREWLCNVYRVHQRLSMAFPSGSREPNKTLGFCFRTIALAGERSVIFVRSTIEPNWANAFANASFLAKIDNIKLTKVALDFNKGETLRFSLRANPTVRDHILEIDREKKRTEMRSSRELKSGGEQRNKYPLRGDRAERFCTRFEHKEAKAALEEKWDVEKAKYVAELNKHAVAMPPEFIETELKGLRYRFITEEACLLWLKKKGKDDGFNIEQVQAELENAQRFEKKHKKAEGTYPTHRTFFHSVLFQGKLTVTDSKRFQETLAAGIGSGKAFGFGLLSVARV